MAKLIVNIIGAPNSRKSTTAFSLFAALKKKSIDCEVAAEAAKEYVLENNKTALEYQLIIWATQAYRLYCAANNAEIVLTDCPLLLGLVYLTDFSANMCAVVLEEHHRYCNLNILMPFQSTDYQMVGRIHDLNEAAVLNQEIIDLLEIQKIPFLKFEDYTEDELVDIILDAREVL